MADIELVIKIPEEEYRWIKKSDKTVFADVASKECMLHAIKNGTPLPDITEDMRTLDRSMECVLESDHRSFSNPETETGWLFDHIIEWRKLLNKYQGE